MKKSVALIKERDVQREDCDGCTLYAVLQGSFVLVSGSGKFSFMQVMLWPAGRGLKNALANLNVCKNKGRVNTQPCTFPRFNSVLTIFLQIKGAGNVETKIYVTIGPASGSLP